MNCQDIARLIDGGGFGAINPTDRQDAEAHAQQCRRCAPLWITHSRLAAVARPCDAAGPVEALSGAGYGSGRFPHHVARHGW